MTPARPEPAADRAAIRAELLARRGNLSQPHFTRLSAEDLRDLFDRYDHRCFLGCLRAGLGDTPFALRPSKRMTHALGLTYHHRNPKRYEIAISATLLFDNFKPGDPPVDVVGLPARDRLEALQLVFEHELIHLAELLSHGTSDCAAPRFAGYARGLFGHADHRHALITPRERAHRAGLAVGARVRFTHDGLTRHGHINRITRRATILVEDPAGQLYSDGRRYQKYYVPLAQLTPIN